MGQVKRFTFSIVVAMFAIAFLLVGCNSDKNEPSALELGIEALENEDKEEAKEQFQDASKEDKDEANEYVELMESAEKIHQALLDDEVEEAVNTYQEVEENEKFSLVTFIFADEEATLTQVLEERKLIDEKINALLAFFEPEDPEMSANELYMLKTNDMLEEEYVTSEQEEAIKEFQEAVQQIIDERTQGSESPQQKPEEEEKEEETEAPEEEGKQEEDKQEEDKQDEENGESAVLSHEEAKDAVYTYLYGEGAGDSSEDSNFKLEFDHDDGDAYVFHYYEVVDHGDGDGHTATLGWYAVDSKTGEVTDIME